MRPALSKQNLLRIEILSGMRGWEVAGRMENTPCGSLFPLHQISQSERLAHGRYS